jgi:hypothetical protein
LFYQIEVTGQVDFENNRSDGTPVELFLRFCSKNAVLGAIVDQGSCGLLPLLLITSPPVTGP